MTDAKHRFWYDQLKNLAGEISRLAIACDIDLNQPNLSERIIKGDESVCARKNPDAFAKLQTHLKAGWPLQDRIVDRVGEADAKAMREEIWGEILKLRAIGNGTASSDG